MKRSIASGIGGMAVLVCAWLMPLSQVMPGPFSAHMTMHMAVVAVAAPLVSFAIAGTKLDPARSLPSVFSPLPASVIELLAVWGWHTPLLHHFARHTAVGLVLEQATFLVSGLLLWLSIFGGRETQRVQRRGRGVLALLLTSMHMTLLGALLALPSRLLYANHGSHAHHARAGALTAIEDQQLGGAIMLVVGGAVYLAAGLWLTRSFIGSFDPQRAGAARYTGRDQA